MSLYARIDRLRARNKRAQTGWTGLLASAAPWALAALVAARATQVLFFGFLAGPSEQWASGAAAVTVRLGWVLIGWLALDLYTSLVRGSDREVLSLLPVDPSAVVLASLRSLAWRRLPALAVAVVVLWPLGAAGAGGLWALCAVVLAGSWALGLLLGTVATLGAVHVARSARWRPLLEALRGQNTSAQAAFIYAPGLALAVGGVAVVGALRGLAALDAPAQGAWLLLPWLLAGLAAWRVPALARTGWFFAGAVVAEIDGRYAALESPEERLAVFGEWLVRWVPRGVGRYLLLDLRCGWRVRRPWISASWACGVLALVAGWSSEPTALAAAISTVAAAVLLLGVSGLLLERSEPEFLRATLPREAGPAALARLLAVWLWLQPAIWVPALALAWRHGLASGQQLWLTGQAVALVAAGLVLAMRPLKNGALAWYGASATVAALAVTWWQVGG